MIPVLTMKIILLMEPISRNQHECIFRTCHPNFDKTTSEILDINDTKIPSLQNLSILQFDRRQYTLSKVQGRIVDVGNDMYATLDYTKYVQCWGKFSDMVTPWMYFRR